MRRAHVTDRRRLRRRQLMVLDEEDVRVDVLDVGEPRDVCLEVAPVDAGDALRLLAREDALAHTPGPAGGRRD